MPGIYSQQIEQLKAIRRDWLAQAEAITWKADVYERDLTDQEYREVNQLLEEVKRLNQEIEQLRTNQEAVSQFCNWLRSPA